MALDISKLTRFDIGREVTYESGPDVEHGHISSWDDGLIFVHFHRGSTAASCKPENLRFSVGGYNENGGESVAALLEEVNDIRKQIVRYREVAADASAREDDEKFFEQVYKLRRVAKELSGYAQELYSAKLAEKEGDANG